LRPRDPDGIFRPPQECLVTHPSAPFALTAAPRSGGVILGGVRSPRAPVRAG